MSTEIRNRIIDNILKNEFNIIVGDANGADKAFQKLFAEHGYLSVQVFCSGAEPRNNIGRWKVNFIFSNQKGRALHAEKDKKMAEIADYGFVLWNGKSIGSLNNIAELLKQNKFSLVYFAPNKQFIKIKSIEQLQDLIDYTDEKLMGEIQDKGNAYLKTIALPQVRLI
ncbi:hypothetical protein [Neisseria dentiae]|uniref:hypothetical protein n=1 Tax=Neisseria dentiae TaxID=194197 RepID=UPI000A18D5E0|nr:hypothetical protein [Neisseria dentiae]